MRSSVLAGMLTTVLAASAALADAQSEIVQAETHAGLAREAKSVEAVHQHLHHALNCLVGPDGKGFDGREMNPCASAGNGAIPDSGDEAKKKALQLAADQIAIAIAEKDGDKSRAGATRAVEMLKAAK